MRSATVPAVLSLTLLACGIQTDYVPLNPPSHTLHARMLADVEVFDEGNSPPRQYVEVATIEARRMSNNHATKEELIKNIRDVAARHGCDAVRILGGVDMDGRRGYRGACITYDEAPAVTATPSPPDAGPNPYAPPVPAASEPPAPAAPSSASAK
ncbi:MAG TPA: hypothetical protein VNO21_22875 [Polyangiaceae bacterium]|nr:hypothetical protein [Polyangiaceae bacterium]